MENLPRNGYLLALSDKNNEDANKYNVVPDIHCQDYIFNALHFFFKEILMWRANRTTAMETSAPLRLET
jgi:hypothetical protein